MPYVPPHKRNAVQSQSSHIIGNKVDVNSQATNPEDEWITPRRNGKTKPVEKVEEFPSLCVSTSAPTNQMNYAAMCKKFQEEKEAEKKFKLPKGVVLLTKNGIVDGLTPEEKQEEMNAMSRLERKNLIQNLYKHAIRTEAQNEMRREWDPNYYDEQCELSYSEESDYESEESVIETDEDEFEPDN